MAACLPVLNTSPLMIKCGSNADGLANDPVVSAQPDWMNDPVVGAPPQQTPGVMAGVSRALENNIPFMDRAVAGAQSVLPQGYGGTGQDYAANLATERAKNAQFAQQNPWTNAAGGLAATAPLMAIPGAEGVAGGALTGAGIGAVEGASGSPDLTDLSGTAGNIARGAGLGAAAGGIIPALARPFSVPADRQALVDALQGAGINPTAGQVTGNQGLQKLEAAISDIPFAGGGANAARVENNKAFTAAMMEKAGAPPGQIATPENLNALHQSLGDQFDALGARNSIPADPQLTSDLTDAVTGYHDLTGTPAGGVAKAAEPLMDTDIPGDKYNSVRSQLGKTAQALRFSDPAQAQAYRDMQDALDSAMERSIAANNPNDLGAFQDVRSKYKNLVPIEQAAGSAGADAASGIISPQQMRTALASGNNRRAYARGIGDLAPLTNAGNAILSNVPQSGTAPRLLAAALLHPGAMRYGGAGLGFAAGGIPGAAAGFAGGVAAPALAGRAIMSRPGQAYLKGALAPAGKLSPLAAALAGRQ